MSTENRSNTGEAKHILCDDHDLWADEIRFFDVDGEKIMVWRDKEADLHAYTAMCPHQNRDLEETGERESFCGVHDDDKVMTCAAHSWEFDLETGEGLNPSGPQLEEYEIGVDDEQIYVVMEADGE